ncbi:MAG: hypothetical protein M9887_05480 [Chitinophagales bacterium]|nr:hypothetical protein [Chitinophagales bacterium]
MKRVLLSVIILTGFHYLSIAQKVSYEIDAVPKLSFDSPQNLKNRSIAWDENNLVLYVAGIDSLHHTHIEAIGIQGNLLSEETFEFESKGIWFNDIMGLLEAYDVDDNAIVSFFLDANGLFESNEYLTRVENLQEVNNQVFVSYNSLSDHYAYIESITNMIIELSPYTGEIEDYIGVQLPADKNGYLLDRLLYSGIEDYPYAILDKKKTLLLFISADGTDFLKVSLPDLQSSIDAYGIFSNHLLVYEAKSAKWKAYEIKKKAL